MDARDLNSGQGNLVMFTPKFEKREDEKSFSIAESPILSKL